MDIRLPPVASLVVSGALLIVSFAVGGCSQGADPGEPVATFGKAGPIRTRMIDVYSAHGAAGNRHEAAVAACMEAKGFEYNPVPFSQGVLFTVNDEGWDPVADAKESGYGITPASKDALIEQYGPDAFAADADRWFDDDPNRDYYDSLSASDQAAYDEALNGPTPEDDSHTGYDWTAAGCDGEATHKVYGDPSEAPPDDTWMSDLYSLLAEATLTDPRVREAEAAWSRCMADNGYSFARPADARDSIQVRYDQLTGTSVLADEPEVPSLDFSDTEITTLHDDEIATATADARCGVSSGMIGALEDAALDVETEFYDAHQAEVDAWFEWDATLPYRS